MTDIYKPRFMNEDSAPVSQRGCAFLVNGGEIRQGDAETVTLGTESMAVQGDCAPSPTFSREQLVEIICSSYNRDMTAREALTAAIDALIALGAVRVK